VAVRKKCVTMRNEGGEALHGLPREVGVVPADCPAQGMALSADGAVGVPAHCRE